ncbi:MAG: hypothetical protein ACTSRL_15970 [Candidatus Helarchaeota archaeon]
MISIKAEDIIWKNVLSNTRSRIQDFANLGDVTGDGREDLIVYAGNYFYVLDGVNGSIVVEYDAHFPAQFFEVIPDVNFDGGNDLLFTYSGSSDWEVLDPYTNDPSYMPSLGRGYVYEFITALKSISCVNGSSVGDVIISGCDIGNSGGVTCLDGRGGDGATIWERNDIGGCARDAMDLLIVPDIDGDGIDNIYLNTYNGSGQGGYMLNGSNGAILWENSSFEGNVYLIPDISGDSISDIVTGVGDKFVYIASNNGSLIFQGPSIPEWGWGRFVADITGDGFPDFINTTEKITPALLTACDGKTGAVLWSRTTPTGFHFTLEINDVDGDGYPEIGCGTCWGDESAYCLSGVNGDVIWKLNHTHSEYGLVFGDVNGNGFQEIINFGGTELVCLDSNSSGVINVSFDELYQTCPDCPDCPDCPPKNDIPTFNYPLIFPLIGIIILFKYIFFKKKSDP